MFTFNSTCAVSFLSGRVHPLSFESPFQLSVSPLLIFFPFSSPPISSLYSFHLNTNCSSSFNLISYTLQFSPAFPLLQPPVSRKHEKKNNNSVLLSQSYSNFLSNITQLCGSLPHNSGQIQVLFGQILAIIHSTCKGFHLYFFILLFFFFFG